MVVVFILGCMLISGIQPTLKTMQDGPADSFSLKYALSWFSFARWLAEDIFVSHTFRLTSVFRTYPTLYASPAKHSLLFHLWNKNYSEYFFMSDAVPQLNMMMNLWLGTTARVLTYVALTNCNREKMGQLTYSSIVTVKVLNPLQDWLARRLESKGGDITE